MSRPYITLQPSEAVIVQAAAQIFAGYLASGRCSPEMEEECLRKSLKHAIRLAKSADDAVQADKEVD